MGGKGSGPSGSAPAGRTWVPGFCHVTVYTSKGKNSKPQQCDQPEVRDGLCLKHLGERIRLSR